MTPPRGALRTDPSRQHSRAQRPRPGLLTRLSRRALAVERRWREVRMFAAAMASTPHPILAQLVPTRRCNLACGYCSEFDKVSQPVPLDEMLRRVDRLAELGTSIVTLSGGEPLLHPALEAIVARIRQRGMTATLISNGHALTPQRIERLNRAGLDYLQVSVDNIQPNDVSRKSLALVDRKLEQLAARARFGVSINTVIGPGAGDPREALAIARRARALGFNTTLGIVHDATGRMRPPDRECLAAIDEVQADEKARFGFSHFNRFQRNLARGIPNDWHCRAGSRYLYVCEQGLVHHCSQRRGTPGTPLGEYSQADIEREFAARKPCEPFCSISCVHHVAYLDEIRERPRAMLGELIADRRAVDPRFEPPFVLRAIAWAFLDNPRAHQFTRMAARLLGGRASANGGTE